MKLVVSINKKNIYFNQHPIYLLFLLIFLDEIMAIIKLDNQTVGQTSWRPCSQQAWDQR
jgi:hypothetical protein